MTSNAAIFTSVGKGERPELVPNCPLNGLIVRCWDNVCTSFCFFLYSPFSCLWFSLGEMLIDLFFSLAQDHTKRPTFDEIVSEMNETVL